MTRNDQAIGVDRLTNDAREALERDEIVLARETDSGVDDLE